MNLVGIDTATTPEPETVVDGLVGGGTVVVGLVIVGFVVVLGVVVVVVALVVVEGDVLLAEFVAEGVVVLVGLVLVERAEETLVTAVTGIVAFEPVAYTGFLSPLLFCLLFLATLMGMGTEGALASTMMVCCSVSWTFVFIK